MLDQSVPPANSTVPPFHFCISVPLLSVISMLHDSPQLTPRVSLLRPNVLISTGPRSYGQAQATRSSQLQSAIIENLLFCQPSIASRLVTGSEHAFSNCLTSAYHDTAAAAGNSSLFPKFQLKRRVRSFTITLHSSGIAVQYGCTYLVALSGQLPVYTAFRSKAERVQERRMSENKISRHLQATAHPAAIRR